MFFNENTIRWGGNIGRISSTTTGNLRFGICQTGVIANAQSEYEETQNWLNCQLSEAQTQKIGKILATGDEIYVEGTLRVSTYNNAPSVTLFVRRIIEHIPSGCRALSILYYKMKKDGNLKGLSLLKNGDLLYQKFTEMVANIPDELLQQQQPQQSSNPNVAISKQIEDLQKQLLLAQQQAQPVQQVQQQAQPVQQVQQQAQPVQQVQQQAQPVQQVQQQAQPVQQVQQQAQPVQQVQQQAQPVQQVQQQAQPVQQVQQQAQPVQQVQQQATQSNQHAGIPIMQSVDLNQLPPHLIEQILAAAGGGSSQVDNATWVSETNEIDQLPKVAAQIAAEALGNTDNFYSQSTH